MSLIQPFEKPEFKPKVPPEAMGAVVNERERWVVEQLSIGDQWNQWNAERLCELSQAAKTQFQQGTHLRNEIADMKDKQAKRDIAYLKKQDWRTKLKELGKLAGAIAAIMGLYTVIIEAIKLRYK